MSSHPIGTEGFVVLYLSGRYRAFPCTVTGRRTTKYQSGNVVHESCVDGPHVPLGPRWASSSDVFLTDAEAGAEADRQTEEWRRPTGGAGGGVTTGSGLAGRGGA